MAQTDSGPTFLDGRGSVADDFTTDLLETKMMVQGLLYKTNDMLAVLPSFFSCLCGWIMVIRISISIYKLLILSGIMLMLY